MRDRFEQDMAALGNMMTEMGALCESAIASAMKALLEGDEENAKRAIAVEEDINRMESEVETLCLKLLLRQQPVARDLRQISSALKMVTDMERIGDQAADIAEIAALGNVKEGDTRSVVKVMAIAAIKMVTDAVDAYVAQSVEKAWQVIGEDDIVDDLFDEMKRDLTLVLATTPKSAESVIDLIMVSKYLERIGDHAVNLAEWVIFAVTGEHPKKDGGPGEEGGGIG